MTSAIGIDLGTTYSCVAIYRHGKIEIIPNKQGHRTTPSYVAFTDTQRLIGDAAKYQASTNPQNTVFDSKRLIGRKYDDSTVQHDIINWPFRVVTDELNIPWVEVKFKNETQRLRPEQISAAILEELKKTAEDYLGQKVTEAVITVPAYFNDAQRQATKDAGQIAGLNVMRIINEPTAAALAYGLENVKGEDIRTVLIFDLGGGTFDVTILTIEEGVFEVMSTNGDTHLGGEDFTNRIVEHFVKEIQNVHKYNLNDNKKAMGRLRKECERVKRSFTQSEEEMINIDSLFDGQDFNSKLSRAKFEDLNSDLFLDTLDPVKKALEHAKLEKHGITDIVLVGGSTRILKIQALLKEFFDGKELNRSINPDEAVAQGAAIQAAKLAGDESEALQEMVLLDVTPLSLGIEVIGGKMDVIISHNTTIPCKDTKKFSTHYDNQTQVDIAVYEGQRALTADNNQLGKFTLEGIEPKPRLVPNIEVTFEIDSDGILKVCAVETSGSTTKEVEIKNEKGRLTKADIERMIQEAELYRKDDDQEKARVDAKLALENLCLKLKSEVTFRDAKNTVVSDVQKNKVLEICDEEMLWLEKNQRAPKEEYEEKTKSVTQLFANIFSKK